MGGIISDIKDDVFGKFRRISSAIVVRQRTQKGKGATVGLFVVLYSPEPASGRETTVERRAGSRGTLF